MICPKCKIVEMRVESVDIENDKATHVCKKCGYTATEEIPKEDENKTE